MYKKMVYTDYEVVGKAKQKAKQINKIFEKRPEDIYAEVFRDSRRSFVMIRYNDEEFSCYSTLNDLITKAIVEDNKKQRAEKEKA